jgi:hypothetical protein
MLELLELLLLPLVQAMPLLLLLLLTQVCSKQRCIVHPPLLLLQLLHVHPTSIRHLLPVC